MNKIQPLDQVRSIVASAPNRTAEVRKNFDSFLFETMILIFYPDFSSYLLSLVEEDVHYVFSGEFGGSASKPKPTVILIS